MASSTTKHISPARSVAGRVSVPGDKSIAHRAAIFGALANGVSTIRNWPTGAEDPASTLSCLKGLGAAIDESEGVVSVTGFGWEGLSQPHDTLDCGNSGTTARLLLGLLAGQQMTVVLDGDASLRKRPMQRVLRPLEHMGLQPLSATSLATKFLPLQITGCQLTGTRYELPIASAQVKSAVLLAGLQAIGPTFVREPSPSRDHTERFLEQQGLLLRDGDWLGVAGGGPRLAAQTWTLPGDFSSAAFLMTAAALSPGWTVTIENVGLNPGRVGFLRVLKQFGAQVEFSETDSNWEPRGVVHVTGKPLSSVHLSPETVPTLIDELPLVALLATQANGQTVVSGAEELRVKESDRIAATVDGLRALGADIGARKDGFIVEGPTPLRHGSVKTHGDHRIAMMLGVAGLIAENGVTLDDASAIHVSWPGFFETLAKITESA